MYGDHLQKAVHTSAEDAPSAGAFSGQLASSAPWMLLRRGRPP